MLFFQSFKCSLPLIKFIFYNYYSRMVIYSWTLFIIHFYTTNIERNIISEILRKKIVKLYELCICF